MITQSGNTLNASGNGIFTWTLNGETVLDSDNSLEITESGEYGVTVMETMCVSEMASGSFEYVGVEESILMPVLKCFPNPATDLMQIILPENWYGRNTIVLLDAAGRVVWSISENIRIYTLELSGIERGCYQIQAMNEMSHHQLNQKIILQ